LKNECGLNAQIHAHSDLRLEILQLKFPMEIQPHEIVAGDAICVGQLDVD
jgi:hypothetical protein